MPLKVLVWTGPPASTENVSRLENAVPKSEVASDPHASAETGSPLVARGVTSSKMLNGSLEEGLIDDFGTTAVVCGAPGATWRSTAVENPPEILAGTE